MTLETLGLRFLRIDKNCKAALFERTPRMSAGQPDVLGITSAGYLLEIEIKRTASDFRANFSKRHIERREHLHTKATSEDQAKGLRWFPKHYWFLVPRNLTHVSCCLPSWAGLLTLHEYGNALQVVTESPVNPHAKKLTPKEMIKLGQCMANQIWSMSETLDALIGNSVEYVGDLETQGMAVYI